MLRREKVMQWYVVCTRNGPERKLEAVDDKMAKTEATKRYCSQLRTDLILCRAQPEYVKYVRKGPNKDKLMRCGVFEYKKLEIIGIKKYKHDLKLPMSERWSSWQKPPP